MNWRGNNNSAGFGFVYFNTNNNQNANTTDYVAFNNPADYSPQDNRFSPVHYSSPTKFQKSPRNFYGRQSGGRNFRYHNSSNSNQSFNSSSFNKSRNESGSHYTRNSSSFKNSGKSNRSKYYDCTCLENPWAELEQNVEKMETTEVKIDSLVTEKQVTDVEESSSSSSGGEQESELETKASSSDLEEETT